MTGVRSFLHAFGPWHWMVFASILLILGCDSSSPEVLPERGLEDLIKIGDQLMDPDTREPFSGWVIDFYPEGEVAIALSHGSGKAPWFIARFCHGRMGGG